MTSQNNTTVTENKATKSEKSAPRTITTTPEALHDSVAAAVDAGMAIAIERAAERGAEVALDKLRGAEVAAKPIRVEKRFMRKDREVYFEGTAEEFQKSPERKAITEAMAQKMLEEYGRKNGHILDKKEPMSTGKKVAIGTAVVAAAAAATAGGVVLYKRRQAKAGR